MTGGAQPVAVDGGVTGRVAEVVARGVLAVGGTGDVDDTDGEGVDGADDSAGLERAVAGGATIVVTGKPLEAEAEAAGSDSATGSPRSTQVASQASPRTATTA